MAAEGRASIYVFADKLLRPDDSLATFALDDDFSFGVLSSSIHRAWFDERCSKLKVDPRYTSTTVWDSFPWPANPSDEAIEAIAEAVRTIHDVRDRYLSAGVTLTRMYDALREAGDSPLRDAHRSLDQAVFRAYGFSVEDDLLAQLLALNLAYAAEPEAAPRPGGQRFGAVARSTRYCLSAPAV